MFNIFLNNISLVESGFFKGFTDYHSHILPSVDDGVKGIDEALRVLDEYESMGVIRVIFTPHIMEAFTDNSAATLISKFENFRLNYNGDIELSLAAEYMLDFAFETHLADSKVLTLWDNYLLVETSYLLPPTNLMDIIKRIKSKGYFVVLAHPERYGYMSNSDYAELKSEGVLFQLNLLSLSGYYGKYVNKKAKYLLKNEMYDLIGSDLHNWESYIQWVSKIKLSSKLIDQLQNLKMKY